MENINSGFIDVHAHLDFFGNDGHINEIVKRAVDNNVSAIITNSDTPESSRKSICIAERFDNVWAAIGVHPHETSLLTKDFENELYILAENSKVVAIGEIGLDYYRDSFLHSEQQAIFRCQLQIAKDLKLPVIIHNREADSDVLSILEEEEIPAEKVLLHCFSSSNSFANEAIDRGYNFSFSGIITFINNNKMENVIRRIPDEKILIETDSPFLPPHPHRGKTNEPSLLTLIGKRVADIKKISLDDFENLSRENAKRFFQK